MKTQAKADIGTGIQHDCIHHCFAVWMMFAVIGIPIKDGVE